MEAYVKKSFGNRTKKPYSNCGLYSMDGKLLSYIAEKKKEWYLKKLLATKIDENNIKLNFKQNNDCVPKELKPRDNICVICGENNISKLGRRHIVPKIFVKYFPDKFKEYRSNDVIQICMDCASDVDHYREEFTYEIFSKYSIDYNAFEFSNVDINKFCKFIRKYLDKDDQFIIYDRKCKNFFDTLKQIYDNRGFKYSIEENNGNTILILNNELLEKFINGTRKK